MYVRLFGSYFALIFLVLGMLNPSAAHAQCAAPEDTSLDTGQIGEVKMSQGTGNFNKLMYCDGTNWLEFGGSPTATACTENGKISYVSGDLAYCNSNTGTYWALDSSGGTNGTCSEGGEFRMNGTQIEYCNGTNWRTVSKTDTTADTIDSYSETNISVEAIRNRTFAVTGITGVTGSFTYNSGGGCTQQFVRVYNVVGGNITDFRTSTGNLYIPNGSVVRLGVVSAPTGSTTCGWDASIGGQNFSFSVTTAAVDDTPSIDDLVDTVGATPSAYSMSNIVKVWAHTGVTASISDSGTGGSPEYQVCADATCSVVDIPWTSAPQALSNPKWIQLRTMMAADNFNLREVAFTAGTVTKKWWTTTANCPITTTVASGGSLTCNCPAGMLSWNAGNVNGTNNYAANTRVCRAALHAGAITNASGGSVTLRGNTSGIPPGVCATFTGSSANGVNSQTYNSPSDSYYFQGYGTDTCF